MLSSVNILIAWIYFIVYEINIKYHFHENMFMSGTSFFCHTHINMVRIKDQGGNHSMKNIYVKTKAF